MLTRARVGGGRRGVGPTAWVCARVARRDRARGPTVALRCTGACRKIELVKIQGLLSYA